MIKSIRFENFYCFKNAKIELDKDINVMIGINGSGKTNFLKAIKLLYEGVTGIGLKNLIIDNNQNVRCGLSYSLLCIFNYFWITLTPR